MLLMEHRHAIHVPFEVKRVLSRRVVRPRGSHIADSLASTFPT